MSFNRLFIIFLILVGLSSCVATPGVTVSYSGQTMGTTYQVTAVFDPDASPVDQADMDYMLWDINQSLSPYIESSLISRINASRDTSEAHTLDLHFLTVFSEAKKVYDVTDGAFNPAVGPLVRAWGFSTDEPSELDGSEVEALRELADFSSFRLDPQGRRLRKGIPKAELDFNAIAKGYAVDEIGRLLEGHLAIGYLVEIGGEIRARGRRPDGRPWRIGIEKPLEAAREIQNVVELIDVSMATSGNYRNYYLRNGQKFVHTINPRTGYPEMNRLLSVTVFADDCITADAYATAFMVMGPDKAKEVASTPIGLDIYLIMGGDSSAFDVFASPGTSRFLVSDVDVNKHPDTAR